MRKERIDRVARASKSKGVDGIILLHGDNMRYMGHNMSKATTQGASGLRYMFYPAGGRPILYEYAMRSPYVMKTVDWMEVRYTSGIAPQGPDEVRAQQNKKTARELKKDMKDAGLLDGKVIMDAPHPGLISALREEGVNIEVNGGVLRDARIIKTPDEIECMRIASAISEGGFEKLRMSIRPGISENELKGIFVGEMYRLGIDSVPTGEIISGPRTFVNCMIASDRIIRNGDGIIAQACQSSFMGYRVCYYRTFLCGSQPSQDQKQCINLTRDVLREAIRAAKPGATKKDIAEKWTKAEEFGYKDEDQALWVQWGHGLGLGDPEEPTMSRLWSFDYPQRIEEGMLLALEDWLPTKERNGTYPRGQSVRLEEMLYVTSGGNELISRYPMDEIIVP